MTPDEILDKGAREVHQGWCQEAFEDQHGNVCAMGGMRRAAFGSARYTYDGLSVGYAQAQHALAEVMAEQFGIAPICHHVTISGQIRRADFDIISEANDTPGRTKEEIVACMQKAAVRCRETT